MSRAFVKEFDEQPDELPERLISSAANLVTPAGAAAIEAEIAALTEALGDAGEDREARARIGRDLRYWTARRASAQLVAKAADDGVVHFSSTVSIVRDGRRERFRIVGEDEADPAQGTISHVSPMARALLGKSVGDVVTVARSKVEIAAID